MPDFTQWIQFKCPECGLMFTSGTMGDLETSCPRCDKRLKWDKKTFETIDMSTSPLTNPPEPSTLPVPGKVDE